MKRLIIAAAVAAGAGFVAGFAAGAGLMAARLGENPLPSDRLEVPLNRRA